MRHLIPLTALACVMLVAGCAASSPRTDAAPRIDPPEALEPKAETVRETDDANGEFDETAASFAGLDAILTIPRGERERWPVVLLLHDHGPMDADGHVSEEFGVGIGVEIATYRELAHALAREGVATLRWDKRTCVVGAAARCTYARETLESALPNIASALLEDARIASEWVRARPEVDPDRVSAMGHGEGAWIALALDADAKLEGVSLVGMSARPMPEQIIEQLEMSEAMATARITELPEGAEADAWREQREALVRAKAEALSGFSKLGRPSAPARVLGVETKTWEDLERLRAAAIEDYTTTTTRLLLIQVGENQGIGTDPATLAAMRKDVSAVSAQGVTRAMLDLNGEHVELSRTVVSALVAFHAPSPRL